MRGRHTVTIPGMHGIWYLMSRQSPKIRRNETAIGRGTLRIRNKTRPDIQVSQEAAAAYDELSQCEDVCVSMSKPILRDTSSLLAGPPE